MNDMASALNGTAQGLVVDKRCSNMTVFESMSVLNDVLVEDGGSNKSRLETRVSIAPGDQVLGDIPVAPRDMDQIP